MSRRDEVAAWLRDPITQQFIAHIQGVIRVNRENALDAAAAGDEKACAWAVRAITLREVLTDGFAALADEKLTKEVLKDGSEQEDAEGIPPDGFADALPQGDGGKGQQRDPHS